MNITLNGKPRAVPSGTSIEELLNQLRLDCRQLVVERNQQIVPRQQQAATLLEDGDALELVHFVGGG